jgi:hypothetical protein
LLALGECENCKNCDDDAIERKHLLTLVLL